MIYYIFKLIDLYEIILLIAILGSWLDPRRNSQFFNFIRKITDPFLNLFRIIVPVKNVGIDISPIIAFFVLRLIREIIFKVVFF